LTPFINDLSKLYRRENRYHSFVHALDVLQAVYCFLEQEGRVAPLREMKFVEGDGIWKNKRMTPISNRLNIWGEWSGLDLLSDRDLFLLSLAAIGHDVGHPGNSNAFLVRCFHTLMLCVLIGFPRKTPKLHYLRYMTIDPHWNGCIVRFFYAFYGRMEWAI
jgi:hypothetical protein